MTEQVGYKQDRQDQSNDKHSSPHIIRINRHERKRLVFALPLLAVGGIALLFSYIYSSLILTFIGLGLTFWGSVLYYITSSRYYPADLFRVVVEVYSESMSTILSRLGYSIKNTATVLFYPRQLRLGGLTQGYIFVYKDGIGPKENTIQLQYLEGWDGDSSSKGMDIHGRGAAIPISSTPPPDADKHSGVLIKAPAQGLIDLFESRLDTNFALMSIDELSMSIERLFLEEFMLADSVEISMDDDNNYIVRATLRGKDAASICSSMHSISTALCPICSSIALAISKSTGKAVMVKESSVGKRRVDTVYSLLEMV